MLACKWVRLACQRHLDDLERSKDETYPYFFDRAKASRVCRFLEQLPHTKGEWAAVKTNIRLEPWQCFIYSAAFGWVRRNDGFRRFRIVYVAIPRKNGKSLVAAGTGNYMLAADGEYGAEVYAGATCKRQAYEVFRPAKQMVQRTPRLREAFGITPNAGNLTILETGSRFEPVVGKPGDGASPSCAIVDEYHEHATDELVDTMRTGMGARKQPLLWIITTAGSNIEGPCHALQRDVEKVLEGTIERDELFGIVYTIDEGDSWVTLEALKKANPNFGVSVFEDFLLSEQKAAIQSPRKQNVFKTKHLNVWVGALSGWLNMERWKALADPALSLDDFAGEPVWIGCDLASSIDIAAAVAVFRREIENIAHYYVFGRYYLPIERAQDEGCQHYQGWLHEGKLIGTPGAAIDFSIIRTHLSEDANTYDVRAIAFDPWAAVETQQELQRELGEDRVISIPQTTQHLSYPMKQLEALVLEKRIHHNGDPLLAWMLSNVVTKIDANDNVFPRKEKPANKIDAAVALIMALSRAFLLNPLNEAGIY